MTSLADVLAQEALCASFLSSRGYAVLPRGTVLLRHQAISATVEAGASTAVSGGSTLCDGLSGAYSVGLHSAAIVIILFASVFGTALPIMTKYIACLRSNPFAFILGKTAATGVLLSVSCIHLINESIVAFNEKCVPAVLKSYNAYSFLLALMAVLLMQALDIQLATVATRWMRAKHQYDDHVVVVADTAEVVASPVSLSEPKEEMRCADCTDEELNERHRIEEARPPQSKPSPKAGSSPTLPHCVNDEPQTCRNHTGELASHGHQHLALELPNDMSALRRVISAVCMEFGVTLHSVFVGLAVGLTTDAELKPLLVALVFHQMFEGMAMGSRLVDASFKGSLEVTLALVFSFSAPAGMAAATIAVSTSRDAMSGGAFVTLMAVLDAFCGGILLYLAFTLLLGDFTQDMQTYCADGLPDRRRKKASLYAALWFGMLLMALVGKWL